MLKGIHRGDMGEAIGLGCSPLYFQLLDRDYSAEQGLVV